jgi:hypothetical protein
VVEVPQPPVGYRASAFEARRGVPLRRPALCWRRTRISAAVSAPPPDVCAPLAGAVAACVVVSGACALRWLDLRLLHSHLCQKACVHHRRRLGGPDALRFPSPLLTITIATTTTTTTTTTLLLFFLIYTYKVAGGRRTSRYADSVGVVCDVRHRTQSDVMRRWPWRLRAAAQGGRPRERLRWQEQRAEVTVSRRTRRSPILPRG